MPTRALFLAVGFLAFALLMDGCTESSRGCTLIGSPSGIAVTVDRAVAAQLRNLQLRICWGGHCEVRAVALDPGTDSVDRGCSGSDPDSACSATAVPNGSLVGFADIAQLPIGKITVSATATLSGKRHRYPSIDRTAVQTFPNGPDCGAGGNQLHIVVGAGNLR